MENNNGLGKFLFWLVTGIVMTALAIVGVKVVRKLKAKEAIRAKDSDQNSDNNTRSADTVGNTVVTDADTSKTTV